MSVPGGRAACHAPAASFASFSAHLLSHGRRACALFPPLPAAINGIKASKRPVAAAVA